MDELLVVVLLSIRQFSNEQLAATNLGLRMGGGTINSQNLAFDKLREYDLIDVEGKIHNLESLKAAISIEINDRVDNDTWK